MPNNNTTLMTSKYRTGVVNDFSVVTKAVIYILNKNHSSTILTEKYKLMDKLPVQVNPNSLLLNNNVKVKRLDGLLGDPGDQITNSSSSDDNATLRFTLIFDIYDEYQISTVDGIIGDSLSELSLANKDVTSLPSLIEYCGKNDTYALFRWGEMRFFGLIAEVNCEYEAFSRWGEPLKCKADVVLNKQYLPGITESDYLVNCFGVEASGKIVAYEKPSDIANKAALTALQALR